MGLGVFVLILILGLLFGNWYLKKEIKTELDKEEYSKNLSYEELSVNILTQNASLNRPGWESDEVHFEADKIQLKNFDIWNYLSNDIFEIEELFLLNPQVIIFDDASPDEEPGEEDMEEKIKIGKFSLVKGTLQIKDNPEAEDDLFLSLLTLELAGINIDKSTTAFVIPFDYKELTMETDSLFYDLNAEHTLGIEKIILKEGNLEASNFKLKPKFSRVEHDRLIPYEKDRANVDINSVIFRNFDWNFLNDSLMVASPLVEIKGANAEIYRNKMLPDDQRIKPMYSEMLRDLGIKIKLDSIALTESRIVYEENLLEDRPPGTLTFSSVQATILNLTNVDMESGDFPVTTVEARAHFMEQSRLTLNWEFDVSNLQDEFQINGSFAGINAKAINPFMKPAMNVETEGTIESLFYNFYGNKHKATGEMKLAYREFKISILKDGEEEKKSFLSGLVNLILKNDVVNDDVSHENINVERDKTKSVWNYFWLCIREGSIKTFL